MPQHVIPLVYTNIEYLILKTVSIRLSKEKGGSYISDKHFDASYH